MQAQKRLSYIVSRLKKYELTYSQAALKTLNKVLAVEPSKENIPDILSIFTPDYKEKQEKLKTDFAQKCNRGRVGGERIQFDLLFRDQKGYLTQTYITKNYKGEQCQANARLTTSELNQYLQTALSIIQMKSMSLQECLIGLLKAIQSYQSISLNKTMSKHQSSKRDLNSSSICEQANSRFEDDEQNRQKALSNTKQTKFIKKKEADNLMAKGSKHKDIQAELQKQSEAFQQLKIVQAQNVRLKTQIKHLETQNKKIKDQHQKNRALWVQLNTEYQQKSTQNSRILTNVRILQREKAELIQQKQEMRKTINKHKTQTIYFNQHKQVNQKDLSSKQQMIKRLQDTLNATPTEQTQIIIKQTEEQANLKLNTAVLQARIKQKEQKVRQLTLQNQSLRNAVQNIKNLDTKAQRQALQSTVEKLKKIAQDSGIQIRVLKESHSAQVAKKDGQIKQLDQQLLQLKQRYEAQKEQLDQQLLSLKQRQEAQKENHILKQRKAINNLYQLFSECLKKIKVLSQKITFGLMLQNRIIVVNKESSQIIEQKQYGFKQQKRQTQKKSRQREAKSDEKDRQALVKKQTSPLISVSHQLKIEISNLQISINQVQEGNQKIRAQYQKLRAKCQQAVNQNALTSTDLKNLQNENYNLRNKILELKQEISIQDREQATLKLKLNVLSKTIDQKNQKIMQLMLQNKKLRNNPQNLDCKVQQALHNYRTVQRNQVQIGLLEKKYSAQISKKDGQIKQLTKQLQQIKAKYDAIKKILQ